MFRVLAEGAGDVVVTGSLPQTLLTGTRPSSEWSCLEDDVSSPLERRHHGQGAGVRRVLPGFGVKPGMTIELPATATQEHRPAEETFGMAAGGSGPRRAGP